MNRLNAYVSKLACVVALAVLPLSPVHAGKIRDDGYRLEPITVTAQKREESAQAVPMSMHVMSGLEIEDAGIDNTLDMTRFIPNVYFRQATMENIIVIRGVPSVDTSTVSPVGIYVDDINYPLHFMHNLDLFDVERIEVLRGPQGTLYGRNTEAGVVNIVTRKPADAFQGRISGEYGFWDTDHDTVPAWRTRFSVSSPLMDQRLQFGISGLLAASDGFMKNTRLDDEKAAESDHKNARGSLRWLPTEKLDILFSADGFDFDDRQGLYRIIASEGGLKNDAPGTTRGFYASPWEQDGSGQSLRIAYAGKHADILSITGRRDYNNASELGTGVGLANYGRNQWGFDDTVLSQEIRVTSPDNGGRLTWLLGCYGFSEDTDILIDKFSGMQSATTEIEKTGGAVFAQATVTLADRYHLTAGLRYDHIDMEGRQALRGTNWSGQDISDRYRKDLAYDEVLPKVSVSWDAASGVMLYSSVAKGYLEGGYNYAHASDSDSFVFEPEYTWNYEIGAKTSWLDDRMIVNVSAYYIEMDDKQVSEYTAGGAMAKISNAAEAHSSGVEMEITARFLRGLDFFASFGWIEAKIDEWRAGSEDFSDNHIPNTPEYTYHLGAQYRHASGLVGRADLLGTGEIHGNVQNDPHVRMGRYELVNLKLGYEAESFDIFLWCKNAFDREYVTYACDYGDPVESIGVGQNGEPRKFGVTATYRF